MHCTIITVKLTKSSQVEVLWTNATHPTTTLVSVFLIYLRLTSKRTHTPISVHRGSNVPCLSHSLSNQTNTVNGLKTCVASWMFHEIPKTPNFIYFIFDVFIMTVFARAYVFEYPSDWVKEVINWLNITTVRLFENGEHRVERQA